MPVEIKELHIKAVVADNTQSKNFDISEFKREKERMKKDIIKECIKEVFQKIEEKNER